MWPEAHGRQRNWLNVPDAISRCRHEWMRMAIRQWEESSAAAALVG